MNGTYRNIALMIREARASGVNLDAVYLSPERWALLPEGLRVDAVHIEGVPVRQWSSAERAPQNNPQSPLEDMLREADIFGQASRMW